MIARKPVRTIFLTQRQREVVALLAGSATTIETAQRLRVSPKTIEGHRMRVYAKLGVTDVAGITRYALAVGLTANEFATAK